MIKATPRVNPCTVLPGINTRYRSSLKKYEISTNTPVTRASIGNMSAPCIIAYAASIPESAPVGPTILKLLPPNIEANNPAHTAVIIPTVGDVPDATASDTDNGIETSDTVSPDFQLDFMLLRIFCMIRCYIKNKYQNYKNARTDKVILYTHYKNTQ
jgi:hypothetical protein